MVVGAEARESPAESIFGVTPHKSTNEGAFSGFEPHSWLCAEKRREKAVPG
jgi:hypothetical protein